MVSWVRGYIRRTQIRSGRCITLSGGIFSDGMFSDSKVGIAKRRIGEAITEFVGWSYIVLIEATIVGENAFLEIRLRGQNSIVRCIEHISAPVLASSSDCKRQLRTRIHTTIKDVGNCIARLFYVSIKFSPLKQENTYLVSRESSP